MIAKKYTGLVLVLGFLLILGAVVWSTTRYFEAIALTQQTQVDLYTNLINQAEARVSTLEKQVGLLINDNKNVQKQLTEEEQKRKLVEQQRTAEQLKSQQQISQLTKDLDAAKTPNVIGLIQTWRPRVAIVACRVETPDGRISESRGSGVLLATSPNYIITTNRHVVNYSGYDAKHCSIQFPNDPEIIIAYREDIHPSSDGVDWATIIIKPSAKLAAANLGPALRCDRKAALGENIIVLGYPNIGAVGDVTATEGIISGLEGLYYITSAKVERGNSGGAAILAKENCYLGTPTYVGAGQIETLARILDQGVIGTQ